MEQNQKSPECISNQHSLSKQDQDRLTQFQLQSFQKQEQKKQTYDYSDQSNNQASRVFSIFNAYQSQNPGFSLFHSISLQEQKYFHNKVKQKLLWRQPGKSTFFKQSPLPDFDDDTADQENLLDNNDDISEFSSLDLKSNAQKNNVNMSLQSTACGSVISKIFGYKKSGSIEIKKPTDPDFQQQVHEFDDFVRSISNAP